MRTTNIKGRGFSLAAAHREAVAVAPTVRDYTLAELVDAYSKARCDGSGSRLRKWLDKYGSVSAWDITSEQLQESARILRECGYAPAAVNRDLSALGSAYKWALRLRWAPGGFRSPTLGVPREDEPIRRVDVSPEQIERLRAISLIYPDRRFGVFVSLLIDTGARKSELLERYGRDFDLDRCEVLAPTTKTDRPRVLFFTPETAKLIARVIPNMPDERLVFEGRMRGQPISYRKAWALVTREAGLPDLHMHDVRHYAAASLLRAGVTLPVAAQVLGHSTDVLQRRYGHLETGALRSAQERSWRAAA